MNDVQSALETRLIDYAATLAWGDLSPAAITQAKRRLADTIGGALGAYRAEPCRIARRLAPTMNTGPRIWGSLAATTPEAAAFANGTALRYLDINDTHRTVDGSHPSDNIGGLVATVEALGGSGRDLILATAISYEIQARFVDAVPFNDNGWDQPVPGVMAMALAAGRLYGLDRAAMRDALALAVIPNLSTYQTRAGELSMWKGCAAANGSRNGIFAAQLAAEGMTGPYQAFDGVFGLWNQTLGKPYDLPTLAKGDGLMAVQQTNIKMYPVRDSCQLPVNTARALRAKLSADQIDRLTITTYASAHKGAVADPELWAPKTRETADHSMLVSVAVPLIDGTITPESFETERFLDADVLDLIGRTQVDISAEFSALTPAKRTCRLDAWEADGTQHSTELTLTAEDIEQGPGDAELEAKFMALTSRAMPEAAAEQLWSALTDLETAQVADIVELTRI
ncbi:MAG: MmgE/PrpD family protein [Pseudomonadota bacterium]